MNKTKIDNKYKTMFSEYPDVVNDNRGSIAVNISDDNRHGFQPCQLAGVFSPVTGGDLITTVLTGTGDSRNKHTVLLDALNRLLHGFIVTHSEGVVGKGV